MFLVKDARQRLRNYHLKSGIFHFCRGELGPALEFLTRALGEDADLTDADRQLATRFLAETRIAAARANEPTPEGLRQAVDEYRAALTVSPSYADVHLQLGAALTGLGEAEEAIGHYRRAAFIRPDLEDAHVRLGFALLDAGHAADARESFRNAVRAREENCRRQLAAAETALDAGQAADAREMYLGAFGGELETFRRHLDTGLARLTDEDWEAAVEEFAKAESVLPRAADVRNYRGVALAEAGRHAEAVAEFQQAARINPDFAAAWLNLACTALALGDLARAERAAHEVLRREPDSTSALHVAEELRGGPRAADRRDRAEQALR